jgi:PAS domain S-box-containing protein
VERTEGDKAIEVALSSTQQVLSALPRAVLVADRDGRIVTWNPAAEVLYHWSAEDLAGRALADVALASPEAHPEKLLELARTGDTWTGELVVARPDGSTVLTHTFLGPLRDADGGVVGLLTSADDVTELHELAQHANALRERLALALTAGRLGTWRWDVATGTTVWDPGLERLFGLEPGMFDGTYETWVSLLHPEDRDAVVRTVEEAVRTLQPYEIEHRVIWPDGSVHWLQGRGVVVVGDDGAAAGTIGCTVEITAQKRLEIETARRAREAETAARRERLTRERLEFLARLNDAARGATDHQALIRRVTQAAVPRLGDWCALYFAPHAGTPPDVQIAHHDVNKVQWLRKLQERFPYDPDARVGAAAVIRTGKLELIPDLSGVLDELIAEAADAAPVDELRAILDELQLTSVITAPLRTKRGVIGAMQFVSAESRRQFDDDDVALAESAADRVAEVLDNAWLMEQHREIADILQFALLPPRLPDIEGVSVAVRYWPAGAVTIVGGDFYDLFPLGDGRWGIVIGDVCGSGPNAAAVTAIARHTIRAAAMHGADVEEVLEWANLALHAGNRELFCTAIFSTLERGREGGWRYTSAAGGHPLPLIVRSDGTVSTVGALGSLLGVLGELDLTTGTAELEPGDTLILYTDGVTDVPPPHDLDLDVLVPIVRDAAAGAASAEVVADRLGAVIHEQLPLSRRNDDVALVVVRVDD